MGTSTLHQPEVWKWNDGVDHIIQAYTHPSPYGGFILKIKRYTLHNYYNASQSGAHQMLFDAPMHMDATLTDVEKILTYFGWPGPDDSSRE